MNLKTRINYVVLSIVAIALVVGLWLWSFDYVRDHYQTSDWQNVGGAFGPISALFSGLAFAGVILSLWFQREDLLAQQKQADESNKLLKAQVDLLQRDFEQRMQQIANENEPQIRFTNANSNPFSTNYQWVNKGGKFKVVGIEAVNPDLLFIMTPEPGSTINFGEGGFLSVEMRPSDPAKMLPQTTTAFVLNCRNGVGQHLKKHFQIEKPGALPKEIHYGE